MKSGPVLLRMLFLLALTAAGVAAGPRACAATNLLKFYVGGGVGRAQLRARYPGLVAIPTGSGPGSFARRDTAWQLTAGIRALEVLGAEVDYFDLGSGVASVAWPGPDNVTDARLSQRGEAAFAVLYLPIPIIDVYFKAGVARLRTTASATAAGPGCLPGYLCPLFCVVGLPCGAFSANEALAATETKFAAGAGVQWKIGNWAIRGDYERFTALGEHPSLVSLGVTWSFL
jgi:opacity protein-like surface antigen